MILLIDNYDSFVYNLDRYLRELGCETLVVRNDALEVSDVRSMAPRAIVISPGPGDPSSAGRSLAVIGEFFEQFPMLGVCLGHQCIAEAFGGRVVRSAEPVHGRVTLIQHTGQDLFDGVANPLHATRYHSLVVEPESLTDVLEVTARTTDGLIMGIRHRRKPIFGVQFHPESILTKDGHRILANFLRAAGIDVSNYRIAERPDNCTIEDDGPDLGPESQGTPLHW